MRMQYVVPILFLLAGGAVAAAEPRRLTLDEALAIAAAQSPARRALEQEVERARAAVPASGLWANPDLSLLREESAGVVDRFATLTQAIPIGGRTGLERSAARSAEAAAAAAATQERAAFDARVRGAFVDLLLQQERFAALEAHDTRLHRLADAMRAREREGESSGLDRRRVAWEAAEARALLTGARGALAGAQARLGAAIGIAPAESPVAVGDLAAGAPLPDRATVDAAAARRGDLAALEAEAERADLLARAARRRRVPEPEITAGAKNTAIGGVDDTGLVIGLGFALPFLDRGQEGGVSDAEAALLRSRRAARALTIAADVDAAWAAAVAGREAEAAYAAAGVPEELIPIALAAYDGGSLRLLELVDAYRTATEVRLRIAALGAEARQAEIALRTAAGMEVTP
jgi:outer membrane protein, heavy metal efflux system